MSARRGEVPFVAVRVGRSNDPREVLGLASELKVPRAHALGLLVLWEEMILEVGDALTGRVRGYTALHVAAKLGWEGTPARLIAALEHAGVLKKQKLTFVHPWWKENVTGQYANARAERRADDAERKRRDRAQQSGDGTSEGRPPVSAGRPEDSDRNPDIKKGRESAGQPPQPPAEAGGAQGASRWGWVLKNHPRPRNSKACMRYLDAMTEDDWALFQWVAGLGAAGRQGGVSYSLSKKRVLRQNTHQILANEAFLEFLPEWREKLASDQRPKTGSAPRVAAPRDDGAENAARAAGAVAFVLAQLADVDLSGEAKEKAKARFCTNHPGITPPWEGGAGDLPPGETTH